MSHVTTTRSPIPITDRAALISAAKKLGAEVLFNAEARGWGRPDAPWRDCSAP